MNRFFVEENQVKKNLITIIGEDVKHIRDVLRLKVGDSIEIVSKGILYLCQIHSIESNIIFANIEEKFKSKNEPPIHIVLYQGLPKSSKMDFIVQKATELGAMEIYPLITNRTVVKINDIKKENKKVERWNKIALESAKQSKRDCIPIVKNIISFSDMLSLLKDEKNILVPYEDEETVHLKDVMKNIEGEKIHIIIGPEGGFEEKEIEELRSIGSNIVSLGPRILRTETAGLVTMSILLYELGDI